MAGQEDDVLLSPRSRDLVTRVQESLELHVSERKMAAGKRILKMPNKGEKLTMSYIFIRWLMNCAVDIFYHYTEVVGVDNLPPPGNAAILCPNHGNSLTDAVVCVSQTPRMVRLTAKDTLFKVPFFGTIVRNVGSIPLQRADEHKDGVDNSAAVTQLNEELLDGQMVCLFPEGRSRFHWKVDEIRYGVATIAYNTLVTAKERGRDDFELSLCPSAFNYLNREKFRSGLVVEYGPPLVVTPSDDLMKGTKRECVQKLSEKMQDLMRLSAYHAEDWNTLRIAHTARNIFAPLGTRMTIVEFVNRTKFWATALAVNDPQDPTLREDLTAYQNAIEELQVKDQRISRPRASRVWYLWCMLMRLMQTCVLVLPAAAGVVMWFPIFYLCKYHERHVMQRKKKPTHVDEVAQYKIMTGVILLTPIIGLISLLLTWVFCSSLVQMLWVCPLVTGYMWLSIRVIEDLFAAVRSLRALKTLMLLTPERHEELQTYEWRAHVSTHACPTRTRTHRMRANLVARVSRRAHICGKLRPPAVTKHGFWFEVISKFDPRRRRKKDWNEVLRYASDEMELNHSSILRILPSTHSHIRRFAQVVRGASCGLQSHRKGAVSEL